MLTRQMSHQPVLLIPSPRVDQRLTFCSASKKGSAIGKMYTMQTGTQVASKDAASSERVSQESSKCSHQMGTTKVKAHSNSEKGTSFPEMSPMSSKGPAIKHKSNERGAVNTASLEFRSSKPPRNFYSKSDSQ